MAKPWGKLEQNYINHPKFLALTANAICLWHEAKNYCDLHHTDGMFPREALRTFRFNSPRAVEQLLRSCGQKPNGEPYAPLWEAIDVGGVAHLRMHDYLAHNDCRDEVIERLTDAEERATLRRLQARKRKQEERARRKAAIAELSRDGHAEPSVPSRDSARDVTHQTETETETATVSRLRPSDGGGAAPPPTARSKRPIFTGQRLTVFEWQLDDCLRTLGVHADAFDLHEWWFALDARCVRDGLVVPKRDGGAWLQAQLVAEAQRRGLPLTLATTRRDEAAELRALIAKGPSVRPYEAKS